MDTLKHEIDEQVRAIFLNQDKIFRQDRGHYTPKTCRKCSNKDCINCRALDILYCKECDVFVFHIRNKCVICHRNMEEGCGVRFEYGEKTLEVDCPACHTELRITG